MGRRLHAKRDLRRHRHGRGHWHRARAAERRLAEEYDRARRALAANMMACSVKHDDVACYELLAFTSKYPEDAKTPEANAALKKHGDFVEARRRRFDRARPRRCRRARRPRTGNGVRSCRCDAERRGSSRRCARSSGGAVPREPVDATPPDPSLDPSGPFPRSLPTHRRTPPDPSRDPSRPIDRPSGPIPRSMPTHRRPFWTHPSIPTDPSPTSPDPSLERGPRARAGRAAEGKRRHSRCRGGHGARARSRRLYP